MTEEHLEQHLTVGRVAVRADVLRADAGRGTCHRAVEILPSSRRTGPDGVGRRGPECPDAEDVAVMGS